MAEIIPLGAISMTSDEALVVELRSSEKSSTLYFSYCSVCSRKCLFYYEPATLLFPDKVFLKETISTKFLFPFISLRAKCILQRRAISVTSSLRFIKVTIHSTSLQGRSTDSQKAQGGGKNTTTAPKEGLNHKPILWVML